MFNRSVNRSELHPRELDGMQVADPLAPNVIVTRIQWLVLLCISFTVHCRAQTYEVEGDLRLRGYDTLGAEIAAMDRRFTVTVSNCSWFISCRDISTTRLLDELLGWEIGGDGFATYALGRYDGKPRMRELVLRNSKTGDAEKVRTNIALSGTAEVNPGATPLPDLSLASYIWLTYASHCYLGTNHTEQLKQIWDFDDETRKFTDLTLPGKWQASDNPPHLPESLIYFNEGQYFVNINGRPSTMDAPKPYDGGWTNAHFEVLSATNIAGLTLPASSRFTRFAPRPNGTSSNDLAAITVVDIDLIGVMAAGQVGARDLLPHLPPNLLVSDNRLQPEIDVPIHYRSREKWLTLEEVSRLPEFDSQFRIAKRMRAEKQDALRSASLRTRAVYAAFVVVLLVPLVFAIIKHTRKPNTERAIGK